MCSIYNKNYDPWYQVPNVISIAKAVSNSWRVTVMMSVLRCRQQVVRVIKLLTAPEEQWWSADRPLPWHVWHGRLEACWELSATLCRKHCIATSITRSSRHLLNTAYIQELNLLCLHTDHMSFQSLYKFIKFITSIHFMNHMKPSVLNRQWTLSSINNIIMSSSSYLAHL